MTMTKADFLGCFDAEALTRDELEALIDTHQSALDVCCLLAGPDMSASVMIAAAAREVTRLEAVEAEHEQTKAALAKAMEMADALERERDAWEAAGNAADEEQKTEHQRLEADLAASEIARVAAERDAGRERERFEVALAVSAQQGDAIARLTAERDALEAKLTDAVGAREELLSVIRRCGDVFEHALMNVRHLTGGDEKRMRAMLDEINEELSPAEPGKAVKT